MDTPLKAFSGYGYILYHICTDLQYLIWLGLTWYVYYVITCVRGLNPTIYLFLFEILHIIKAKISGHDSSPMNLIMNRYQGTARGHLAITQSGR